jgi:hypothetical protein
MFQAGQLRRLLDMYRVTDDPRFLEDLRAAMIKLDFLAPQDKDLSLLEVKKTAEEVIKYRKFDGDQESDGLDSARHNLRLLRNCNLPDTRLIVCSMQGPTMYPDIANLLTEPEFADMMNRLVITAVPSYLARFTSCNHVVAYQRRFMNAAQGQS